jgi:hypothetical protein
MKLYTINATPEQHKYTIQQNRDNHKLYPSRVAEVLAQHKIDGFTIERVEGYWQGVPEKSYKISVAVDDGTILDEVCELLRDMFQQDAVMLTSPDNSVKFI